MTRRLSFDVIEGGRDNAPQPAFVPDRPRPRPILTPAEAMAACAVVGLLFWAGVAVVAWQVWGRG